MEIIGKSRILNLVFLLFFGVSSLVPKLENMYAHKKIFDELELLLISTFSLEFL